MPFLTHPSVAFRYRDMFAGFTMLPMPHPIFPGRGSSALRVGRISEAGRIYLISFVTLNRARTFSDWDVARATARSFAEARLWRASQPLCWVLMPDHWHGLMQLSMLESLPSLVGRLKAVTARSVNRVMNRSGTVWDRGYHEHAVRRNEDCVAIARCIVRNPLRAGLCDRVGDYPFWNASWLD